MKKIQNYKHTKKAGLISFGISIILIILLMLYLFTTEKNDNSIIIPSSLLILFFATIGISFMFFNKPDKLRKKTITIFNILSFTIIGFGILFKIFQLPGASIFIVSGSFMLSFLVGPLAFISKFEKWKYYARASKNAVILSLSDLIGKIGLIIGILFKLMQYPGANVILLTGSVFFVLSYLIWSREFQKEVVLRKRAEDKLKDTLDKVNYQKHEIEEKNEELHQLIEEVNTQKEEIEIQRDHANEQKEEIISSINYAKRIQKAVLPSEEFINEVLPEHFILFKPRDIVSGDFYWIKQIKNFTIVAVADCTGHGVPGAFMSMLGSSFLNEIVTRRSLDNSGEMLNRLRAKIKKSLKQEGKDGEQKDGMDIAFYIIDDETLELQFSGAYNPLYIIRNEDSGIKNDTYKETEKIKIYSDIQSSKHLIIEIKADRQPIAIHLIEKEFDTQHFQLQKGDCLYTFSDGYADQFGGEKGGKFKTKNFKNLLLTISEKPMPEQKQILNKHFEDWRGNIDQIDDVIVVGIRI